VGNKAKLAHYSLLKYARKFLILAFCAFFRFFSLVFSTQKRVAVSLFKLAVTRNNRRLGE